MYFVIIEESSGNGQYVLEYDHYKCNFMQTCLLFLIVLKLKFQFLCPFLYLEWNENLLGPLTELFRGFLMEAFLLT